MKRLDCVRRGIAGAALLAISGLATAVPTLQLGIDGGTYDSSTQTIISSGPSFTLYAFMNSLSLTDDYFISASIVPAVSTATNLGSFTFDGKTINVTAGMAYGAPPLDATYGALYGDLQPHSIFPTYFSEFGFKFNAGDIATFDTANTQDNPSLANLNLNAFGPVARNGNNGLYYAAFAVDVSNLDDGSALHFDLYNTDVRNCKGKEACTTVASRDDFAPFSHDAQSGGSGGTGPSSIPEPNSMALVLLGLGLLGAGFVARRKV